MKSSFSKTIFSIVISLFLLFMGQITVVSADGESNCYTKHVGPGSVERRDCYKVNSNDIDNIDEWSICRDVDNNNSKELFIPTRTSEEWGSIVQNGAPDVDLDTCQAVVFGCTDSDATNYNPLATDDDGSCSYCSVNQGNSCQSGANSCGQRNTGTIQCNGSCSATTPSESGCVAVCPTQGQSCTATNACGGSNTGTIGSDCNCSVSAPSVPGATSCSVSNACGTSASGMTNECGIGCSASAPAEPGATSCQACNSCNQCNTGSTNSCGQGCSATAPAESGCTPPVRGCTNSAASNYNPNATVDDGSCIICAGNAGSSCSASNSCGQSNTGTIQCDGSCSASAPAAPGATSCSATNACGASASGMTDECGNGCSATAPDVPGATSCSVSNACGASASGMTDECGNGCSASPPAEPGESGCSACNSCDQCNSGTTNSCGQDCSAAAPSEAGCGPVCVQNSGEACTSGGNNCGDTNTGTVQCDGSCSVSAPQDRTCSGGGGGGGGIGGGDGDTGNCPGYLDVSCVADPDTCVTVTDNGYYNVYSYSPNGFTPDGSGGGTFDCGGSCTVTCVN